MRSRSKKQLGFTLMEMMIALLIGAILVSPMYIVTRSMSQHTDTERMEVEAMQRARTGVDTLLMNLRLTGLSASPDTETDVFCANEGVNGSTIQYRNAVVHLNRNRAGNDAMIIVGSFLGGDVYEATISGGSQLYFAREDFTEYACTTQFSNEYADAHLTSSSRQSLEAKVESVSWSQEGETGLGVCNVTLRAADLDDQIVGNGDIVYVSANQTALFWVEPQGDHNVLVRYFIDYVSGSSPDETCTVEDATTVAEITLPGESQVVESTRQVIAEYVEDFQVWFRPASINAGTTWVSPHQYPISGGSGIVDEMDGNFSKGFLLSDEAYVFPKLLNANANSTDLSCESEATKAIRAEHIRSAMVRLSIRTEMTDQSIDATAFSGGRIAGYTVKAYEAPEEGTPTDKPGAAYKLKTLLAEVSMPNLAARSELAELGD